MNDDVHEQMRRFIEHVLPAKRKVPRRTEIKNTLDVAVFSVLYRHHWVYSKHFRHGSMIIQFATIQLWSAITGTRPGVLLPQNVSLADKTLSKRKRDQTFKSDLPKYVSVDNLPASVCYRDIELFYLKDPDSKRDVLCAIIEFRNLKGRPEGADGTKFFRHGDYQLASCPINQIISLAFRDDAFLNTTLTPELIWRLRVPKRSPSLPPRWKPEKLDTPPLRRLHHTPYGLSMTYDSSPQALQELGRDAGFEDNVGHYNYRRWTANEVNRNFTSQERQRVLGQSGDAVLKNTTNHSLATGISSMSFFSDRLRKRDPLAPSDLTDAQKVTICQHPKVIELRREKRKLMEQMRSLAGTIGKAKESFPQLYRSHEEVKKELSRLRKSLANDTQETVRLDRDVRRVNWNVVLKHLGQIELC
ncbi:hypothetical protein CBS147347_11311 [Aspergillus niger]|nr:hypothetical protein CBS147347_11311 [Aspergillus niger]